MSYVLHHTAEAIDDKLKLIDINKNLLPYPYDLFSLTCSSVFEDGSILISIPQNGNDITSLPIHNYLATCTLPTGKKYIASIEVIDNNTGALCKNSDFSLKDPVSDYDIDMYTIGDDYNSFIIDLTNVEGTEVTFIIQLCCNWSSSSGLISPGATLLLKPQIEEVQIDEDGEEILERTTWVPYMKTISSYIDERFNSTNAKIKLLKEDALDIKGAITDLQNGVTGVTTKIFTAEVLSSGSESWGLDNTTGIYSCEVSVFGILESDNPTVDILLDDNDSANWDAQINAWSTITRIKTDDNKITLYAIKNAPETAFNIQLKVVR